MADPPLTELLAADALLSARVESALANAREAWPTVSVDRETYVLYLDERLPRPVTVEALDALALEDLYLACACASGLSPAIEALERAYAREIEAALQRTGESGLSASDLRQRLRTKLFGGDGGKPRITAYRGEGPLRGWIRVTMRRLRIDAERRRKASPEVTGDSFEALAADADPELLVMQDRYREVFRAAFATAIATLTERERALLEGKLQDDLSTDALAREHGVHRATLKRWLAAARGKLLTATMAELEQRLGATGGEAESIIRLLRSNFDVSVRRLLQAPER